MSLFKRARKLAWVLALPLLVGADWFPIRLVDSEAREVTLTGRPAQSCYVMTASGACGLSPADESAFSNARCVDGPTATLRWVAPTNCVDGSALTRLDLFTVYSDVAALVPRPAAPTWVSLSPVVPPEAPEVMARVQSATSAWGIDGTTGVTATFGSTPATGRRLIATLLTRNEAYNWTISGSGWELIGIQRNSTDSSSFRSEAYVWTKVAGESEPTAITVTPDESGWTGSGLLLVEEFPATGRLITGNVSTSEVANAAVMTTGQAQTAATFRGHANLGLAWVFRGVKMTDDDAPEQPPNTLTWTPTGGIGDLVTYHPGSGVGSRLVFASGYQDNPGTGALSYGLEFSAGDHRGGPMFVFAFEKADAPSYAGGYLAKQEFDPSGPAVTYGSPRSSARGGTTLTMPEHRTGDLLVIIAYRDGSNTAPSLPSGWTNAYTATGSNTNSHRVGYKIATGDNSESSGTWANASTTFCIVFKAGTFNPREWGVLETANVNNGISSSTLATLRKPAAAANYPNTRILAFWNSRAGSITTGALMNVPLPFVGVEGGSDSTDSGVTMISTPLLPADFTQKTQVQGATNTNRTHTAILRPTPSQLNLTSEGTDDWVYFGDTTHIRVDKSGGSGISAITEFGGITTAAAYTSSSAEQPYRSWTDGDEVASATDQSSLAYWATGAVGAGISFTVPADTTPRRVRIHGNAYLNEVTITATLSDASASAVSAVWDGGGAGVLGGVIEFDYAAASASQTLTISLETVDAVAGNIALHAITLESLAAPAVELAATDTSAAAFTGAVDQQQGLSGTDASAAAFTGVVDQQQGLTATDASTAALTGNVDQQQPLAATAASVSAMTGDVEWQMEFTATVAAAAALSGEIDRQTGLSATDASAAALIGTIDQQQGLTATAAAAAAFDGTVDQQQPLAATVSSAASFDGTVDRQQALTATDASVSGAAGAVDQQPGFSATDASVSAIDANIDQQQGLAATDASVSTLAGGVDQQQPLTATVSSATALTGVLDRQQAMAAAISALSGSTGDMVLDIGMSGTAPGTAGFTGAITGLESEIGYLLLDGSATAVSTAYAAIGVLVGMTSQMDAVATFTPAALDRQPTLSGDAPATGGFAAALDRQTGFSGTTASTSASSSLLGLVLSLSGTSVDTSLIVGTIAVELALSGQFDALAELAAELLIAVGDPSEKYLTIAQLAMTNALDANLALAAAIEGNVLLRQALLALPISTEVASALTSAGLDTQPTV